MECKIKIKYSNKEKNYGNFPFIVYFYIYICYFNNMYEIISFDQFLLDIFILFYKTIFDFQFKDILFI